jgi:hypothetical protein
MSNYNQKMQDIVKSYRSSGNTWPTSTKNIAGWAIQKGYWRPQPSSMISQCADHISTALRDEYITDPQGRRVRAKHSAKILEDGKQVPLWADIREASPKHMHRAFQQRRQQIVGDCRQLRLDADSYNENVNKEDPIQIVFDFTLDLEEMEEFQEAS